MSLQSIIVSSSPTDIKSCPCLYSAQLKATGWYGGHISCQGLLYHLWIRGTRQGPHCVRRHSEATEPRSFFRTTLHLWRSEPLFPTPLFHPKKKRYLKRIPIRSLSHAHSCPISPLGIRVETQFPATFIAVRGYKSRKCSRGSKAP
jgi:hypothetical protein